MRRLLKSTEKEIVKIMEKDPNISTEAMLVELDDRGITVDYPGKGKFGQEEYETMWSDVQRYMHDKIFDIRNHNNW